MIGFIQIILHKSFIEEVLAHQTHHEMTSKKTACVGEVVLCFFFCLVKQYGYRPHRKKNVMFTENLLKLCCLFLTFLS